MPDPATVTSLQTHALLAWRPFLDPLGIHDHWWLSMPLLALGIAIAYKGVRVRTLDKYWQNVGAMTVQVVGAMILLALCAHAIIEWFVPLVAR